MTKIALRANSTLFSVLTIIPETVVSSTLEYDYKIATSFQTTEDGITLSPTIKIGSLFDSKIRTGIQEGNITEIEISAGETLTFKVVLGKEHPRPEIYLEDDFENVYNVNKTPLKDLMSQLQLHWIAQ
jgi:hypothetical protein